MNYLAHLLLAGQSDASRIGNLLGDFAKGTPESLEGLYPPEVIDGIVMHRKLDRFTDQHEAFLDARALLSPERRRFAGIVVDVFFDHFLTIHWDKFGHGLLPEFISEVYTTFERHPDWLHEDLVRILPRMKEENWLHSYGTLEGLALTFERISRRSRRTGPIAGSEVDLFAHYQSLDRAFHQFFPAVQRQASLILSNSH